MRTIKINVAGAGHPTYPGQGTSGSSDSSAAGHMWITKDDGSTVGYGQKGVTGRDEDTYKPGYWSIEVQMEDNEYEAMENFLKNAKDNGFGPDDYDVKTNSCVDFVWKALEKGGKNPTGFQGSPIPAQNIDYLNFILFGIPFPTPQKETSLFEKILGLFEPSSAYGATLDGQIQGSFQSAQAWVRRGDPLAFDLDGDGLETTGIDTAKPIYFDHDGDGVKTATGWINSDDGLLVYDRNGNGSIDCGRELFGDSTTLAGGTTAADGFAALAGEDSNGDGRVDAADAHFAGLRIWRDINGDGISQADELLTLESLGIASISVAKSTDSTSLANGNSIAGLGSYTKTDGSTGIIGDINFRENTFLSRFADAVPLTAEAETLPEMHGAGQVRNLQEAASLSTDLAATLATYAAATSGDVQKSQLDTLLKAWSDTSQMATTATGAYAGHALTISFQGITTGSPEYLAWLDKLTILERFNGQTFREVLEGSSAVMLSFQTPQMDYRNSP